MDAHKTVPQTQSGRSNANGLLTIPPNKHRVAILIGNPAGRTTVVQMGSAGDVLLGPTMGASSPPLLLSEAYIGTAVQEAITIIDSAGAQQTFAWVEFLKAP